MPIYEFYCPDCHTLFNFLSKTVNTTGRPTCPRCRKRKLDRQVSAFAVTGKAKESDGMDDLPIDEARMESAIGSLASEAESIKEDDPRQAAQLMRKFSKMTGVEFGGGMREALNRLEAGEDPEKIEADMGDAMEQEEPFVLPGQKSGKGAADRRRRAAPQRDPKLYEM